MTIQEKLKNKWFCFQAYIEQHEPEYTSEHEVAIHRAIVTSDTPTQAKRKLRKLRGGRLNKKSKVESDRVIDDLFRDEEPYLEC